MYREITHKKKDLSGLLQESNILNVVNDRLYQYGNKKRRKGYRSCYLLDELLSS